MAPSKGGIAVLYNRLADFNIENLFVRKSQPGPPRSVYVNQDLPEDYHDKRGRVKKEHIYTTNQVVTSKYTIITFLPRNLLEQFRRIANIFFAAIAILQFFPLFSTINPGLVLFPIVFILTLTAAKDGYEDIKRHQSDRHINYSQVHVLNGGTWSNRNAMKGKGRKLSFEFLVRLWKKRRHQESEETVAPDVGLVESAVPPEGRDTIPSGLMRRPTLEYDYEHRPHTSQRSHSFHHHATEENLPHWKRTSWEDVRVGDFVKIVDGESFPADILICATSEDENMCYVETKNLDGETNLKSRSAVPELTHLRNAEACANRDNAFRIDLDRPDSHMYKLNGAVVTSQGKYPIDLQTVLLRGTHLRHTSWVIGVVMFTGLDTKIVLNAGGTPSKRSRVEKQMNPQVFINLGILAAMAVACAILDSILEHRYYPRLAPWLIGANRSDDNPSINGLITFAFSFLTFQNIVPISLYISIEVVRTCQALFIFFDKDIMYEKTDQPTLARSWNLSDDLGQIEYIFSDKTGTLTQNLMVFKHCSIGGKVYRGEDQSHLDSVQPVISEKEVAPVDVRLSSTSASGSASPEKEKEKAGVEETEKVEENDNEKATSSESAPDTLQAGEPVPPKEQEPMHFVNEDLQLDISSALSSRPPPAYRDPGVHSRSNSDLSNASGSQLDPLESPPLHPIAGFFNVLALCHTVLASVDPHTDRVEYKAQSPDEAALVQAAADAGFIFRGRDKEILKLQTPFAQPSEGASKTFEEYELLNLLDFTSARKRMSVLLRKRNGDDRRILLLTKGADNVIFERLRPGENDELRETTGKHLDEFAGEGLRTLTLAYRFVSDDFYVSWNERYEEATVALDDREGRVEAVSDEIERDLHLLGATAIEDRLQDGVPETIADLKLAGIKVWVATGDKLETAIAIGYSTNLIEQQSNLIVIRGGGDHDGSKSVYQQMVGAVETFFPQSSILQDEAVYYDEKHDMNARPRMSLEGDFDDEGEERPISRIRRVNTGVSSIVGRGNGERPGGFVLVIEGTALGHALAEVHSKALLLKLAMLCEGVICCRVSPLQKALIVRLVKDGLGAMTLAIGDGANDVSMLQAADVGVGISGEEGLQAVNSSDYAIAQFRFLKRLLFVHGHWSYARNGNMIVNFFYKNIICIGILWWFQIYCGWSSQYAFEYTYLLWWNVFWTLCPVIGMGVFDRIVDDDILMELPELYRYGREGHWYSTRLFAIYMIDAVYQSAVIYFLVLYGYFSPSSRPDGYDVAQNEFSTTMVIVAVLVANAFNGLNTSAWTAWVFFAVSIGIILVWAYTAIYSIISPGWFYVPVFGNQYYLFHSAIFWFSLPIAFCLSMLPRYIAKSYRFNFAPTDVDVMRWIRKVDPSRRTRAQLLAETSHINITEEEEAITRPSFVSSRASISRRSVTDARGSRTDMVTGLRSFHRGFDFATEENGVAMQRMQTNLSERRQSSRDLTTLSTIANSKRRRGGPLSKLSQSLRRKKPTKPTTPTNNS